MAAHSTKRDRCAGQLQKQRRLVVVSRPGSVHRIGGAIDEGRKPGMPLSILSNIAREAPLGSLLVAFLLGVAVARRR